MRWLGALMVSALALIGLAVPAQAAGVGVIAKTLDPTQGNGFTAPNTFETGALVRYRISLSCSSNRTDCGPSVLTDVLDANLTPVDVVLPQTSLPMTKNISGQTVTVNIGTATSPWPDGNPLEIVIVARVKETATGTILNKATVTTNGGARTSPEVAIEVPGPENGWGLDKGLGYYAPGTIAVGETARFAIYFTVPSQFGQVGIVSGTLVDTLPAGAVLMRADGTEVPDGGSIQAGGVYNKTANTITWPVGALSATGANCSGNPCRSWTPGEIYVKFPSPPFQAGDTPVNTATATVRFTDGTTSTLTDTQGIVLQALIVAGTAGKGGPRTATTGEVIGYRITTSNTGNSLVEGRTLTETLPTSGLTNMSLRGGYGVYAPNSAATFEWFDGTTWNSWFRYDGVASTWTNNYSIPAGATAVRAIIDRLAPGNTQYFEFDIYGTVTGAVGDTIYDCAEVTGPGLTPSKSCFTTTVVEPQTAISVYKGHIFEDTTATNVRPGDVFSYYINVHRISGSPLTSVDLVDMLPSAFEYVSTDCFFTYNGYTSGPDIIYPGSRAGAATKCLDPAPADITPVQRPQADGSTLLQWLDVPSPNIATSTDGYLGVLFKVRVKAYTSVANYTNTFYANSSVPGTKTTCDGSWYNFPAEDIKDYDSDGSTTDTLCGVRNVVQVRKAAIADVYKWVKGDLGINADQETGLPSGSCPNLDGYTRYPCVAEVSRGGTFDYLFQHVNTGNVELTDFTMYDILPFEGDTGVNEALKNDPRGTVWTPIMTGPVTFDAATTPAGADPVVMYSLSSDPCRPEAAEALQPTNWQGPACDNPTGNTNQQNTWYTAAQIEAMPGGWANVRSFKTTLFTGERTLADAWQPGQTLTANAPMQAPVGAPESSMEPLSLSVAWNSMAHKEFHLNADGTTYPLLSAAPRMVGIIVPFPGVSVGDYVWLDTNRDGLQSLGETPIAGVTVNLRDANGAILATTTTDADGYYSFRYLAPSTKHTIEFVAPQGMTFTTPNSGGVTSNDPVADNGSTALDGTTGGDSDAIPSTDGTIGSVTFTTQGPDGAKNEISSPTAGTVADNPGLDAGFVTQINLSLKKAVTSKAPYKPGSTVTYSLTPHNDGPMDAIAGWSVTDLLPAGLSLVSMTGTDYDCTTTVGTCTSTATLPAKSDGNVITVTATIDAATQPGDLKNVAYVSPAQGEVTETNPLAVPDLTTDTTTTNTDNDAEATITVANPVSIGDYVWWDTNRDGQQGDPTVEKPVAGMTVNLYAADGTTSVGTTTTDTNGYYAFTGLAPSTTYIVEFVKPVGTRFTTQNATTTGATDANDSDADVTTGRVTVTTPDAGSNLPTNLADKTWADDPSIDAGLVQYNLVLDKTLDTEGPFVPGQTVKFTLTPKNQGPTDALYGYSVQEILPTGLTLTSMTGTGYTCAGVLCTNGTPLKAGETGAPITVTATIDAGFTGTLHNVAFISPWDAKTKSTPTDDPETNPLVIPTTTTDTSTTDTDNDAQADLTVSPVSIGDYVFWDVNRDGQQGAGDTPIAGVTVELYAADGTTFVKSTSTDTTGYYYFQDLAPGTDYVVKFIAPTGAVVTIKDAAPAGVTNPDATDSDPGIDGLVNVTTPTSGSNLATPGKADDPTIDAGYVKLNLSLAKTRKGTEPVYAGSTVTFTLTPHNDGPVNAQAGWSVTDLLPQGLTLATMDGGANYSCDTATAKCTSKVALLAGANAAPITVTATVDARYVGAGKNVAYVSPAPGEIPETNPLVIPTNATNTATSTTDNDAEAPLTVASLVSIGDYVWMDTNRDGVQDATEDSVPGITVSLSAMAADGTATFLRSTTTDASGYYYFKDLTPGVQYVVKFGQPAGYSFTGQNLGNDDTLDSDANPTTGSVVVTAPASGSNLTEPEMTDDPTIDAGYVQLNLTLQKALTSSGPYYAGSTVTFALTPYNAGPANALPGWSVTDVLPAGLTLVSMAGDGYTCTSVAATATDPASGTCIAADGLSANTDGKTITVTATVDKAFVGKLHNVAYVSPSATEVPETNVLVIPTTGTDTSATDTDNDAQAELRVDPLVSVGDYVWLDVNRDGKQGDPTVETPVDGVIVTLRDAAGAVVGTTTTNADGFYSFVDLRPGKDYTLTFNKPDGYSWTTQTAGFNWKVDSDVDPATGVVAFTSPTSGLNRVGNDPAALADDPSLDGGLVKLNLTLTKAVTSKAPYYAGSTVTFTLTPHNDGPVDALGGWSVTDALPLGLTPVSMTGDGYDCTIVAATATAGATGTCTSGAALPAGKDGTVITVTATINKAFVGSLHNVAYVSPSTDEVPETNPLVVPTTDTDTSGTTTDNDDQASIVVDSLVSIGDYVWMDTNRDGVQDATEAPVKGITVSLYAADGTTFIKSMTTGDDGYYYFADLTPGVQYVVKFGQPAGYSFTGQNLGGNVTLDSNPDPATGVVVVTAPASGSNLTEPEMTDDPTIDAGYVQLNLTLQKALTSSGPYYAGSTVTFALTPHNAGPADALAGWSVTDVLPAGLTLVSMAGDGYTCTGATCVAADGLAAGKDGSVITVTAKVDKAFVGKLHNVAYVSPSATEVPETNVLVIPTTGTDTSATDTDNDAQAELTVDPLVSVGDYVWLDVNRDGKQGDPTVESPVAGVVVTLRDAAGAVVGTTTTNADGFYSFVDLLPGKDYTLTFTKPDGYSWTTQTAGFNWKVDSDVDPKTGVVEFTSPTSGKNSATTPDDPSLDGGLVKLNLTLTKKLTSKGPFYTGSTVTFALTPHNDGPVDALANWSVTDVLPKGLTLVSMAGDGYDCTGATCVAAGGLAAGKDGNVITVTAKVDKAFVGELHNVAHVAPAAGEVVETNPLVVPTTGTDTSTTDTDNDAQAKLTVDSLVSVGDYVWTDVNRDGLQGDPKVEAPIKGVVVNLYAADGTTLIASTKTDDKGFYSFVDLVPGQDYVIEFVKPKGSTFTTANSGTVDTLDSDADVKTGRVSFKAPAQGVNSAVTPDDPSIDAGIVSYDLTVTKTLVTTGVVKPGDTVSYTLVAHNAGPADVLPGWTLTDQLPKELTLVSMTGDGFTCSANVCTADKGLAAGADSGVVTVTATVGKGVSGTVDNVAVVAPSGKDVPESNPNNNTDTKPVKITAPKGLAFTGANLTSLLFVGGLLLLLGVVFLAAGHRRREERTS